ncbi:hypothetical protein SAMN05421690_10708 [Nitrosomonas sp. Nm51]|nr:hypothetical protein SAMN05421690_10708 [Nitrosomonas sp. Nm51]
MNRLSDYLNHIKQATTDACGFVEGLEKEDFLADKRTQQAIIMFVVLLKVWKKSNGYLRERLKFCGHFLAVCMTAKIRISLSVIW